MERFICFVIAISSILLWVNLLFSDVINAKVNPYQKTEKDMMEDKIKNRLKIILLIITSLFFGYLFVF